MKEYFQFEMVVKIPHCSAPLRISVVVDGATVTLSDARGRFARGVWDAGHYVRYPRSQQMPVHPQLLDDVDAELRIRMTHRGVLARAD